MFLEPPYAKTAINYKYINRNIYLHIQRQRSAKTAKITENQEISCLWLKNKRYAALICGQALSPGRFKAPKAS